MEFSASAYFINVYWASWLNESYWERPQTKVIDNCDPPNIISPGYALWLALVPAVGCAVQLPGSTFLYRRSNFYRFAPEIGLADCLATAALVGKALRGGYRWKESVAAALLVREGVGTGELSWREGGEMGSNGAGEDESYYRSAMASNLSLADSHDTTPTSGNNSNSNEEVAIPNASDPDQHTTTEDRETGKLVARLRPYAHPISTERVIGSLLFVMSLIKTIAIFATAPSSPSVRLAACIALSYSFSFIVFEGLLWSLAFVSPDYSLADVPVENLLELLRAVDPGDNPFTFPRPSSRRSTTTSSSDLEMHSGSAQPGASTEDNVPWNKAVAVCASSSLVFGTLIWVLMLRSMWLSNKPVFILSITTLAYFAHRLLWRLAMRQNPDSMCIRPIRIILGNLRAMLPLSGLSVSEAGHSAGVRRDAFMIRWALERLTTVNLFSTLWLTVIVGYYAGSFGQHSGEEHGPLLKPMWLDWLG